MVLITVNGDAAIAGLREQIMANAIVLFQALVHDHKYDIKLRTSEPRFTYPSYVNGRPVTPKPTIPTTPFNPKTNTDYVPASEAFDILVVREASSAIDTINMVTVDSGQGRYCAVIMHKSKHIYKVTVRGEPKKTVSEALNSLLDVTATRLKTFAGLENLFDDTSSAECRDDADMDGGTEFGKDGVASEKSKA
ncbi:hypothetical protein LTR85_007789 [Meristemomyces frigidus]|nr:hypothetical protein LTR85_007789 [Meristemomyces frigidus]